jgi:GT2 family glycosyltransferase
MIDLTCSIVLYNNNLDEISKTISCFLNTNLKVKLYLIDNSPSDLFRSLSTDSRIEYYHNSKNIGFGAAHNIAIKKALEINSNYHLVLNPDVYFDYGVVDLMYKEMVNDLNIGMMMPKVLNIDGTIQYLPKLLPSPFNIILRKFKIPKHIYLKFINLYELRFVSSEYIYNSPILSGCFTMLNLNAITEIGMYDDNYFMYFEDWDLSRRMHDKFKTLYYPLVSIYHRYDSGANKNFKLFYIYIKSSIHYFNKWGWFLDKNRISINQNTLNQFKS